MNDVDAGVLVGQFVGQCARPVRRIVVDDERKTSLDNVWAGGDCVGGGEDLTVCAVQDGKLAARSIHDYLKSA